MYFILFYFSFYFIFFFFCIIDRSNAVLLYRFYLLYGLMSNLSALCATVFTY